MTVRIPVGKYCEIYGNTLSNQVMEFFLEAYDSDVAVSEITGLSHISKPKVYDIIDEFMRKKLVMKSRVIGKTQMYKLNTGNPVVKIYIRNFKECLDMVAAQHSKSKNISVNSSRAVANAKSS